MTTPSRTSLGKRVRELRTWSGLTIAEVAKAIGCSTKYYSAIEHGHRRGTNARIRLLADVLDCEVAELKALSAWYDKPEECDDDGCGHHGKMKPGGTPAARHDSCRYYSQCLSIFVFYYPMANSSHCPANCKAFWKVPHYIRMQLDSGQNGDTRYDDAEAPGDLSLPLTKKRLPMVRHSGTQTAQLCTCTNCNSIRGRKSA